MSDRPRNPRALIIGLDGGTFDLLKPMADPGSVPEMPNLKRVLDGGAHGVLRSTLPPLTAPAWSSFLTGQAPGRHGVFSFQRPLDAGFERVFVNSTAIRAPQLWHWLAEQGLTTGLINVPMTWPPQPMPAGSYVVTGMLTPDTSSPFADPPELADRLRAQGYVCDLRVKLHERDFHSTAGVTAIAHDLLDVLHKREQAIFDLARERPTDVLVVVFETPDRLQHWAWRAIEELLDNDGSLVRTSLHEAVERCYGELDRVIGRLLEQVARPETHIFFLSDHGFGPLRCRFHVDQWLSQNGWLSYEGGKATLRQRLRGPLRRVRKLVPRALLRRGRRALAVNRIIDWQRTAAYSGRPMEHAIYINLRGREPHGIVPADDYDAVRRQIADALLALRDPRVSTPIVQSVYLREELFSGPYVEEAPDLLFELVPGYEPTCELSAQGIVSDARDEGAGIHQPEGIFAAAGPGIKAGATLPEHRIEDVLPTVLYGLGLAVPAILDGRVIEAAFEPAYLAAHPTAYSDTRVPESWQLSGNGSFSAEDATQVAERLAALGYLG